MAPRLGLAALLWAARSQETVLIDHDGDMRQFTLYAGEAGCSAPFVARRFLEKEAKRGLWGDDDVATLAARVAVNDNGFAEGGRRCGWWQELVDREEAWREAAAEEAAAQGAALQNTGEDGAPDGAAVDVSLDAEIGGTDEQTPAVPTPG